MTERVDRKDHHMPFPDRVISSDSLYANFYSGNCLSVHSGEGLGRKDRYSYRYTRDCCKVAFAEFGNETRIKELAYMGICPDNQTAVIATMKALGSDYLLYVAEVPTEKVMSGISLDYSDHLLNVDGGVQLRYSKDHKPIKTGTQPIFTLDEDFQLSVVEMTLPSSPGWVDYYPVFSSGFVQTGIQYPDVGIFRFEQFDEHLSWLDFENFLSTQPGQTCELPLRYKAKGMEANVAVGLQTYPDSQTTKLTVGYNVISKPEDTGDISYSALMGQPVTVSANFPFNLGGLGLVFTEDPGSLTKEDCAMGLEQVAAFFKRISPVVTYP